MARTKDMFLGEQAHLFHLFYLCISYHPYEPHITHFYVGIHYV